MSTDRKPSIKARDVELVQEGDVILLRRKSKTGQMIEVKINAGQLQKWAMRQMREGVFA